MADTVKRASGEPHNFQKVEGREGCAAAWCNFPADHPVHRQVDVDGIMDARRSGGALTPPTRPTPNEEV